MSAFGIGDFTRAFSFQTPPEFVRPAFELFAVKRRAPIFVERVGGLVKSLRRAFARDAPGGFERQSRFRAQQPISELREEKEQSQARQRAPCLAISTGPLGERISLCVLARFCPPDRCVKSCTLST